MAPELLNNEENYGQEVDVYSFAMLAYELVTGKAPFSELFASKTADSFTKKVTEGYRPKFPEFVPKKMQDLITKCWSFKPSERPSFDEIYDELSKDFTLIGEIVDEDEIKNFLSYINNQVNIEEKAIDMNEENKKINEKLMKIQKTNNELRSQINEIKNKLLSCTKSNEELSMALLNLHGHKKERDPK